MIGTAKKETADEKINNPPKTRLNARAQGRSLKIPMPAISPAIPVARIRRANARRAGDLEKAQPQQLVHQGDETEDEVQPIKDA